MFIPPGVFISSFSISHWRLKSFWPHCNLRGTMTFLYSSKSYLALMLEAGIMDPRYKWHKSTQGAAHSRFNLLHSILYDNQGCMSHIVKESTCTYYKPIEVELAQPDGKNARMPRTLCLWAAEVFRFPTALPQFFPPPQIWPFWINDNISRLLERH